MKFFASENQLVEFCFVLYILLKVKFAFDFMCTFDGLVYPSLHVSHFTDFHLYWRLKFLGSRIEIEIKDLKLILLLLIKLVHYFENLLDIFRMATFFDTTRSLVEVLEFRLQAGYIIIYQNWCNAFPL